MSRKFKDDEDAFFLFLIFFVLISMLIIYISWKYIIVEAPNLNTEEGRCKAFCAGIGVKSLGYQKNTMPLTCFCETRPVPPNERMLKRP